VAPLRQRAHAVTGLLLAGRLTDVLKRLLTAAMVPISHKRFIEMAKELEADQSGAGFERAFRKIVSPKSRLKAPKGSGENR
jgi:hypothetical protein